ncbi:MAG: ATP-binding protein [Thermodesulfovibrionales bacterium]|nr:ATP-binding protein [Thermodesulfovibrionales bacterium]MDP3110583.1 ATP-binding protein [Thermodesulfovibrionales bacterium]
MKIRDKLFLGFGLYTLLAAILGFFAYKELRTVTVRLALVETADDITNTILEVRRYEKVFLLLKDKDSQQELKGYLGILKKDIDDIKIEIIKEIGGNNHDMMKKAIAEYENFFNSVAENLKSQDELITIIRETGRTIEKRSTGRDLQTFLTLRKDEKNLMLYKNEAAYETFMKTLTSSRLMQGREIERYTTLVKKLYEIYKQENASVNKMRVKAREIQSFTESLSKKERADIGAILNKFTNLLLYALLAIIILGAIINIKLATSISTPIRDLEKITKKVTAGDLSESVAVEGNDEIASLAVSFNIMEEKLRIALTRLENKVIELREKQSQLVEAEKLASIGILATGIAHELNNPLTSVLTFSHLMLEDLPKEAPYYEKIKIMARETERARNIVRQLLSFAKETPLNTMKININRPVTEIIDSLIAQGIFKDIELALNLSDTLPVIYADPARIGQVVLNILLNAVHAITTPGKIEVTTRVMDNFLEIIFSDTGCGISEEHITKIFDPFFTTKDLNKGTGLGLAVSYGIIKKHGGEIRVESSVGKGSTFIVRLPVNV